MITKIELNDIFSYKGSTVFDFTKGSVINTIIGENGFGKTSFVNAIKMALHGITKETLKIGDTILSKNDFIMGAKGYSGLINRESLEEGIKSCSIAITFANKEQNPFTVVRTYKLTSLSFTEHLCVFNEKNELMFEDDNAQDFLNENTISNNLSKFLLFDGEKVQEIANFSSKEFAQMLEDVFEEIGVFEQVIEDMKNLKRTYLSESITDVELKNKFIENNALFDTKKKEIEEFNESIKSNKLNLRELKKKATVFKNKINKIKSENKEELVVLENELFELKTNKAKKLEVFKSQAVTHLPLLVNPELRLLAETDIFSNYYDLNYLPIEILNRKKVEFLELLNNKIQRGEDISNIMEIFDKVFFSENQQKRVKFVDTSKIKYQYESLDIQVVAFGILLDDIIDLDFKIDKKTAEKTNVKIAIRENEIALDSLLSTKELNSNDIALVENSILDYEKAIKENKIEMESIEKSIFALSRTGHKEDILQAKIKTCEKTIKVAKEAINITKIQKRAELEAIVNSKFKMLIKENYDAAMLKIHDDFTINLYDKRGKAMDILSSSSGQKQIIATALIWAVSEYLNTEMPMVIDTPLGRLDDKNQELLIRNFYPEISNQIIMLPTPSELRAEGFKELIGGTNVFKLSSNGSVATASKGL